MQLFVQGDGAFVGETLHGTVGGVAAKQQVGLASQITCFDCVNDLALVVQQLHLGAGGDVQACFNGTTITQGDAGTRIGAQQTAFA